MENHWEWLHREHESFVCVIRKMVHHACTTQQPPETMNDTPPLNIIHNAYKFIQTLDERINKVTQSCQQLIRRGGNGFQTRMDGENEEYKSSESSSSSPLLDDDSYPLQLVSAGYGILVPPSCSTSSSSSGRLSETNGMVLIAGGYGAKGLSSPTHIIHALNPMTLCVTPLACPHAPSLPLPELLYAHTATAIRAHSGACSTPYLVLFGGGHDVVRNDLFILDLHSLQWRQLTPPVVSTTPATSLPRNPLSPPSTLSSVDAGGIDSLPPGRRKHTCTDLPHLGVLLIHGGRNRHNVFSDSFIVDYSSEGGQWTNQPMEEAFNPAGAMAGGGPQNDHPNPRYGHTMVYSQSAGGVILFGGFGITGPRNDVWLLGQLNPDVFIIFSLSM